MQSIKRDLSVGLCASALLFVCALAWGSPFVLAGAGSNSVQEQPQPQQDQAQQTQAEQSKTFTGTVQKAGSDYVLRDSSGQVYKLDNADSAKAYEGKAVKVTGQLDEQAMLIHVETIESNKA